MKTHRVGEMILEIMKNKNFELVRSFQTADGWTVIFQDLRNDTKYLFNITPFQKADINSADNLLMFGGFTSN